MRPHFVSPSSQSPSPEQRGPSGSQPLAGRLIRGSELKIKDVDTPIDNWVRDAYAGFAAVMEDDTFPCLFARQAHKRDTLQFLFAESASDSDSLAGVATGIRTYLDEMKTKQGMDAAMSVLNVLFKPESVKTPLETYHSQAWNVLQYLHDHDPLAWPVDVPIDPDDPLFSFCFAGVPLFINVSCPAHVKRRSRNLGPSLTLVLQPREGFDGVGGSHPKGDDVRKKIRLMIEKFDGQSAAPELGTYSRPENREWMQYVILEENGLRDDRCPLRISSRQNHGPTD